MVVLDNEGVNDSLMVQIEIRVPSIVGSEKKNFKITGKADVTRNEPIFTTTEVKIYRRRWLQLILYFIHGAVNGMQWIHFTIVGHIISRYYGVSSVAVDCTSVIFHVAYIVLVLPATYVMDRVGLRWICLIGAIGTAAGSWIKYFSVYPGGFAFAFFGQTLVAMSQIFVLNGPPRLAADWFGSEEVATATAVGCTSVMAGVSLFFLIVPIFIKNLENIEDIGEELSIFCLTVAVVSTVVTVALFFFFLDQPPLPPSQARALQESNRKRDRSGFWLRFKRILTNKSFIMLWNAYGMSLGYLNAVPILLSPSVSTHFTPLGSFAHLKNGDTDAGRLGILMNLPGIIGAMIFGMILDKTKKFKALSIFIYCFSLLGEISFAVNLVMEVRWLLYATVVVIGISTITQASIGFELSAEITYPEPEEVPSGLLNLAQHVYGVLMALIVGILLRTYGDTVDAHSCLTGILMFGLMLSISTKNELKRQNAVEVTSYEPVAPAKASGIHRTGRALTPD